MNQYIFQLPRLNPVSSPQVGVSPGPASCCWLPCPPPAETTPSGTSPTCFIQLVLHLLHFPTLPNSTAEVTLTNYTGDSSSASPEIATHNSAGLDLNQEQHTSQNYSLTHVFCIINGPGTRLVASSSQIWIPSLMPWNLQKFWMCLPHATWKAMFRAQIILFVGLC